MRRVTAVVAVLAATAITGGGTAQAAPRVTMTVLDLPQGYASGTAKLAPGTGVIVGSAWPGPDNHPRVVAWRDGKPVDIGRGDALDVNRLGAIVGTNGADVGQIALMWRDGQVTELLPGNPGASRAVSVNDRGEVLVQFERDRAHRTGVWRDGRLVELPVPGAGEGFAPPSLGVINQRGQVAGAMWAPDRTFAYRCDRGNCAKLPDPPGLGSIPAPTVAISAINERGQVAGRVYRDNVSPWRAVAWSGDRAVDLGTLGGDWSFAAYGSQAINSRGDVVGTSATANGTYHAFLWRDGKMIDLGTLGGPLSAALAVNDRGDVIGQSYTATSGEVHAFLWRDGRMIDLGAAPDGRSNAVQLTDTGQIVGDTTTASGESRPVVWTVS
ncbi:putative HAF family extracellular repeat protein [Herbihabitans rhizosphaerae]|uniref:Putative HAF family extracellular repeat protein n=1 Tax=Herbihabitans rhizosphaerae TaxID=1872711 RepID=A0A4Q7KK65_9PSEU|nr:hypothetical protein [Herbihabitans rhizosphaerae]RZS36998.1 putative HAF family extracellular repeat protein [Herbihabitans rhizosphaerae]